MRKTPFSYGVPAARPKFKLDYKPQKNILKKVNLKGNVSCLGLQYQHI
jgi:hypothetical protein